MLRRVRHYLDEGLWATDASRLPPARRPGTHLLRLVLVAVRASRDREANCSP